MSQAPKDKTTVDSTVAPAAPKNRFGFKFPTINLPGKKDPAEKSAPSAEAPAVDASASSQKSGMLDKAKALVGIGKKADASVAVDASASSQKPGMLDQAKAFVGIGKKPEASAPVAVDGTGKTDKSTSSQPGRLAKLGQSVANMLPGRNKKAADASAEVPAIASAEVPATSSPSAEPDLSAVSSAPEIEPTTPPQPKKHKRDSEAEPKQPKKKKAEVELTEPKQPNQEKKVPEAVPTAPKKPKQEEKGPEAKPTDSDEPKPSKKRAKADDRSTKKPKKDKKSDVKKPDQADASPKDAEVPDAPGPKSNPDAEKPGKPQDKAEKPTDVAGSIPPVVAPSSPKTLNGYEISAIVAAALVVAVAITVTVVCLTVPGALPLLAGIAVFGVSVAAITPVVGLQIGLLAGIASLAIGAIAAGLGSIITAIDNAFKPSQPTPPKQPPADGNEGVASKAAKTDAEIAAREAKTEKAKLQTSKSASSPKGTASNMGMFANTAGETTSDDLAAEQSLSM